MKAKQEKIDSGLATTVEKNDAQGRDENTRYLGPKFFFVSSLSISFFSQQERNAMIVFFYSLSRCSFLFSLLSFHFFLFQWKGKAKFDKFIY